MEKSVGSYEAKTNLPALLREVGNGYSITITNHGHPIARLVPIEPQSDRIQGIIQGFRELARQNGPLSQAEIRELRDEGRR